MDTGLDFTGTWLTRDGQTVTIDGKNSEGFWITTEELLLDKNGNSLMGSRDGDLMQRISGFDKRTA